MTTEEMRYRAFIATLITLVLMFAMACWLAREGKNIEAIGVGSIMVGLIGLAGVLAAGKQQDGGMNENFNQIIKALANSSPIQPRPEPETLKNAVRRGAEEGTRSGVNEALGGKIADEDEILQ
jgi:hypothetical protein